MKNNELSQTESIESKVELILSQMTLREKVSLLSGKNAWQTVPIDRLNIPSLTMTDGPHGVRANRGELDRIAGPATSFPTGVSMAATWDTTIIEQVGEALAEETRAMGCEILLGPCVNIVRTPVAGRNFESYSEDPHLAGKIGVAWVKGLQKKKVGASLKHFACNNQELERSRGDSIVDERTLREIYLAQFEMVVKEAEPWTVMCSYNRLNGQYASQNDHLLNKILKDEWGYKGVVVSDWGANHTTIESVANGLDLEMPGPARYYGRLLEDAVRNWQIDETHINNSARRVLRMMFLSGKMDADQPIKGAVNTKEHQNLARIVAEESITLLKNEDHLLPLNDTVKSIAVIGPNAAECRIGGGGSSYLEPPYRVSPLQALDSKLGKKIHIAYEQGCDNVVQLPALKAEYLSTLDGTSPGIVGKFYNNLACEGQPSAERIDEKLDDWQILIPPGIHETAFSIRWEARLSVPMSGRYIIGVDTVASCQLFLDHKLLISIESPSSVAEAMKHENISVQLETGKHYALKIEYVKSPDIDSTSFYLRALYAPEPDDRFDRAVKLAQTSDIVFFFGGMPKGWESEGADRPHMQLTGDQDKLIAAIAHVNPNTVVVLNAGSPVEMPWIDKVKSVLLAYYPGQEGGNALANILTGEVNPSGKLTVTFPKRYVDNPTYINYPGTKKVHYGEGIFVGYRYYDMKDIDPLFPFGHGLSYTTFAYSTLSIPDKLHRGDALPVSLTVTNTGNLPGKEVVQLYIHDPVSTLLRPPKELKGFTKVELNPGESKTIEFMITERDLSFFDPYQKKWTAEAGHFEVMIGSSAQRILLRQSFELI